MRLHSAAYCYLYILHILPFLIGSEFPALTIDSVLPSGYRSAVRTIRTYRQTGAVQISGLNGDVEILFAEPDRLLISYMLGPLSITQGFDGETAWAIDQNQQVVELSGNERKMIINSAYLVGHSFLDVGRMPGPCFYLNDTVISKARYHIFLALPEGGDSLWLYFSQASKHLTITAERLDEIMIYTYQSDFRKVNGVEFPFRYITESSLPQLHSETEITRMERNIKLNDAAFIMRGISRIDFEFPSDRDSVTVPFSYSGGHIYIKASLNGGDDVYFLLDSGAGLNIIDKKYAEDRKFKFQGGFPAKGIAGYDSAGVANLNSIRIGEVVLLNQIAAVVKLENLGLSSPGRLGGLIGYDLLSRFPAKVDYGKRELTLYNPQTYTAPDSQFAVPLSFTTKIPTVEVEIDGKKGRFLVDLGNSLGVILHKSFADRHNLEAGFTDIKEMAGGIGGIGGLTSARAATGNLMKLGPARINQPKLIIVEGEAGVLRSTELDGNIGNMMLQRFLVFLDYRNQQLYLLPPLN